MPQDSAKTPLPAERTAEPVGNFCPNCGARLKDNRCKLNCPDCGFFLSCSDFY